MALYFMPSPTNRKFRTSISVRKVLLNLNRTKIAYPTKVFLTKDLTILFLSSLVKESWILHSLSSIRETFPSSVLFPKSFFIDLVISLWSNFQVAVFEFNSAWEFYCIVSIYLVLYYWVENIPALDVCIPFELASPSESRKTDILWGKIIGICKFPNYP